MIRQHAGQPGVSYDLAWWGAVRALYEAVFPGLPAGIDRAAAAGVRWEAVSTPFALFEGERCIAHVGVISHPLRLGGRDVLVAGVHAVATAADRRGQGRCRQLLDAALEWADRSHDLAKLHTESPGVFAPHGFEARPTARFTSRIPPVPAGVRRRLLQPTASPADAALLQRLLAERCLVSQRCATRDPGWMVTIDAALSGMLDSALWYLPDHDAVVAFGEEEGCVLVCEVVASALPPAAVVRAAAPQPDRTMRWSFAPDLFEPDAVPIPTPADAGVFMTRGPWPEGLPPVGISPLWEH